MEVDTCSVCQAIILKNEGHNSAWCVRPSFLDDLFLRHGNLLCSECYLTIWGEVQNSIRKVLRTRKGTRKKQIAPYVTQSITGDDIERIFKKVVAAGSPPADARSSTG